MKHSFYVALLFSTQVFANDLTVDVQQFSFQYNAPHGEGTAQVFSHSLVNATDARVTVDKVDDVFKIALSGSTEGTFEFKDAPSFMKNADSMQVENFNLALNQSSSLSLDSGNFLDKKGELELQDVNVSCNRDLRPEVKNLDQFILGCVQRMGLTLGKFSNGDVTVRSATFKSNGGKYNLVADVKMGISGTAKSTGTIAYDETQGILTVKISEVKLGILNVTGQVFKQLKKSEGKKVRVDQPYVYITVK